MIYNLLLVGNAFRDTARTISVNSAISENNSSSNFYADFDNVAGRYANSFALNDMALVFASNHDIASAGTVLLMDEGSGNATYGMASFLGFIGSLKNKPTWSIGKLGSCLGFNGSNQYVAFYDPDDDLGYGNQDDYSVSVWFNTTTGKDQSISEHWEGGGYPWVFRGPYGHTNGTVRFNIYDGTNNPGIETTSGDYRDGQWHNMVGVRDWTNRKIKLYVDGNLIGSTPDYTNGDCSSSSPGMAIGARNLAGGYYFSGLIDNFVVYGKVLSDQDARDIWNNGSANPIIHLFTGLVEDIEFSGEGLSERLKISGRDYSCLLQDITIPPIVYRDKEVSFIVKDIMNNFVPTISTKYVKTTLTTIDRITFNHDAVFDALKQLAEISGFYFYVDVNLDLHFEEKQSSNSGYTFDNTNTMSGDFRVEDRDIYNKVWVYGQRILTAASEDFTANGGSVFTLTDKPHNTAVYASGILQQPGGVILINDPYDTLIKYVVDFDQKKIVFVSGLTAGDNIPASGTAITIDYDRSTPIIKYKSDNDSIVAYGPKTKVIVDKTITTSEQATEKVNTFLAQNKDPIINGYLAMKGLYNLIPGQTALVNFPNYNISGQTYTIYAMDYDFNPTNNSNENVLAVNLNKKVTDITDTIKGMIQDIRKVETGDYQGEVTTFVNSSGTVTVDNHWEVWTKNLNNAFILHASGHNILNSPTSLIGNMIADPVLIISGGTI